VSGSRPPARGPRTTAALAVVLVPVLIALLVGLVGLVGSDGPGAVPATSVTASAAPTSRTSSTAPRRTAAPDAGLRVVALSALPREAQATVALIDQGGPFPYSQDGATFGNYAKVLPAHPRGWYREYTVRTPGERDRGPRRIVTGDHDTQIFYTGDHYATFVRVSR
jgi:ribonuclease T1